MRHVLLTQDMVFNSLALFFLLELDNLVVQADDYEDVQAALLEPEKHVKVQKNSTHCFGEACLRQYNDCAKVFQCFFVFLVLLAAFVGPFAVFLCW